ncbi:hypothetical protein HKCCE4037_05320 [Rhodobacterales bacterium HKCCE4037]|nr:hypothetical protein [Rhodobacterales bacterium HKCCE4037]
MRGALLLPLVLAACVGGRGAAPVADGPVFPVAYDARGIDVVGSGQRIDFGRAQAGVIDTMSRLQGDRPAILQCDNASLTGASWSDGPILVFRNGSFTGWRTESGDMGDTCAPLAIN